MFIDDHRDVREKSNSRHNFLASLPERHIRAAVGDDAGRGFLGMAGSQDSRQPSGNFDTGVSDLSAKSYLVWNYFYCHTNSSKPDNFWH